MKYETLIKEDGFIVNTVVGNSMNPTLYEHQDIVHIDAVQQHELCVGDIVLYKREQTGHYILHRIQKLLPSYALICGDNRIYREKVPYHWIIGRVSSVRRFDTIYTVENIPLTFKQKLRVKSYSYRVIVFKIRALLRRGNYET